MRYRHGYLVIALAILLAACGGQLSNDVSGTWVGELSSNGNPISLELTQTGTSLEGTVSVADSPGVPMTGTAAGNLISLSYVGEATTLQIEASVTENDMQGTVAATMTDKPNSSAAFTASR